MKRTMILAIAAICFGVASHAGNLVKNGDFSRTNLPGNPPGWESWGKGKRQVDNTVFRGAPASYKICSEIARKSDGKAYENNLLRQQRVELEPNTVYRVSGWMKGENIVGGGAACFILREDDKNLQDGSPAELEKRMSGSFDWTKFEFRFDTRGFTSKTNVAVHAGLVGATGTLWLDDIAIEKCGTFSEFKTSIFPVDFQKGQYALCENYPGLLVFRCEVADSFLRADRKAVLQLELPAGIKLAGAVDWDMHNPEYAPATSAAKESEITRNGMPYRRYDIEFGRERFQRDQRERIFLMADAGTVGLRAAAYWRFNVDGQAEPEKQINLEVLAPLPAMPRKCRDFGVFVGMLSGVGIPNKAITDYNFNFWLSMHERPQTIPPNYFKNLDPQAQRKIIDCFDIVIAIGAKTIAMLSFDTKTLKEIWGGKYPDIPRLVQKDGEEKKAHVSPWYVIEDPNGIIDRHNREQLAQAREKYPFAKALFFDFEPESDGFDQGNLERFQKHLKLAATPSREEALKKHFKEWFYFRYAQNKKIAEIYAGAVKKYWPEVKFYLCTEPLKTTGFSESEWCAMNGEGTDGFVDMHMDMPYYMGTPYFDNVQFNIEKLKKPFFPLIDPSEMDINYYSRYTPKGVKQNIVATAALGGRGIGFWLCDVFDGHYLHAIRSGFAMVAPVEDIYAARQRADADWQIVPANVIRKKLYNQAGAPFYVDMPNLSGKLRATVHKKDNDYVITLLNYNPDVAALLKLSMPRAAGECQVAESDGPVYLKNKGNLSAGDLRNGFLVEVPANGVKVIKVFGGQHAVTGKTLAQEDLEKELGGQLAVLDQKDAFKEISKDGAKISWGVIDKANVPVLNFIVGGSMAGIDLEGSGDVVSWRFDGANDLMFHKNRGFLGRLELYAYDAGLPQPPYRFVMKDMAIVNGCPQVDFSYRIPTFSGANPTPNPWEGLIIDKKITMADAGKKLVFSFKLTNDNLEKKTMKVGFRVKNMPSPGSRLAGESLLTTITRVMINGEKKVGGGAPGDNLFLRAGSKSDFLKGVVVPAEWNGKEVKVMAEQDGLHDNLTIAADTAGSDGIYVWWSNADVYTVELLAEEKTLAFGESYAYGFTVTVEN